MKGVLVYSQAWDVQSAVIWDIVVIHPGVWLVTIYFRITLMIMLLKKVFNFLKVSHYMTWFVNTRVAVRGFSNCHLHALISRMNIRTFQICLWNRSGKFHFHSVLANRWKIIILIEIRTIGSSKSERKDCSNIKGDSSNRNILSLGYFLFSRKTFKACRRK